MNPAFSVVIFTTVCGAAQGLVTVLGVLQLVGHPAALPFQSSGLLLSLLLLLVGLAASFAHLGRPARAWRSVLMWRTSWLSREVIVLPMFIVSVSGWWWALTGGAGAPWLMAWAIGNLLLAMALWYCTAMIYACLRFIEEWAHPLTVVYYALTGLSSGLVLTCALAASVGEVELLAVLGPAALMATLLAWALRVIVLRRNAGIRHRSTLQSATGLRVTKLVQTSMGMSAGSFNTREFFHRASAAALKQVRLVLLVFGYALPVLMIVGGLAGGGSLTWLLALLLQVPGLIADRWYFFAQARHPQNLYYQKVS